MKAAIYSSTSSVAEPDGASKLTVKTWSSDSVPLGGMVRIEQNGKTVYELLDFGREKAP